MSHVPRERAPQGANRCLQAHPVRVRRRRYDRWLSFAMACAALVGLVVLPQLVSARPSGEVLATTATPEAFAEGGVAGTMTPPGMEAPLLAAGRQPASSPAVTPNQAGQTPPATVIVAPLPSPSPSPAPETPSPSPRSTHKPAKEARLTAVFLGDSYTSGYAGAGSGSHGWPSRVAKAEGWRVVNLAVPGTGFVNPGWTGQPVRTQVRAAIGAEPSVVVLAAGHNDSHWSRATIAAAADRVIDRLRSALPQATLIIIGPIWPDGHAPTLATAIRDHLRAKARAVGAVFIDPIAGGWFAGSNHRLIGADGIHPTDAGYRHIAAEVLDALEAAGEE